MEKYYLLLDSNLDETIQIKNIKKLADNHSYENIMFIQPNKKRYWENAARVLMLRGYPKIADVIPGMFEWLQDMNWPGSTIILSILEELPKEVLVKNLERSIIKAYNDEVWLDWLYSFINDKVVNENDFNNKDLYSLLNSHSDFFK